MGKNTKPWYHGPVQQSKCLQALARNPYDHIPRTWMFEITLSIKQASGLCSPHEQNCPLFDQNIQFILPYHYKLKITRKVIWLFLAEHMLAPTIQFHHNLRTMILPFYLHSFFPWYPEVTAGQKAGHWVTGQVMNPSGLSQLHHDSINPREPSLTLPRTD